MKNQSEKTNIFSGYNGLSIFYRYSKADPERARMVISHGLGEHSGRYAHVIDGLVSKGISVWALDHRGHGKSDGKRGHILSFDEYIHDLSQMIETAKKDMPENMKLFLLGHSMGGCIVLYFAQTHAKQINGVIVSSPGLRPAIKVPVIKGAIGKMMSSIWPTLSFDNELNSLDLSHDKSVVSSYDNDPLVHRMVTSRWFTQFMTATEMTFEGASKITVPILMQVAGTDRLVDAKTSKVFFEKVSSTDKTLHYYDDLYHEIYNETETDRQRVLGDLDKWLEARI